MPDQRWGEIVARQATREESRAQVPGRDDQPGGRHAAGAGRLPLERSITPLEVGQKIVGWRKPLPDVKPPKRPEELNVPPVDDAASVNCQPSRRTNSTRTWARRRPRSVAASAPVRLALGWGVGRVFARRTGWRHAGTVIGAVKRRNTQKIQKADRAALPHMAGPPFLFIGSGG